MIYLNIVALGIATPELKACLPVEARLLRKLPGPDRPDYWLAELSRPFQWLDGGHTQTGREISHLIIWTRQPLERLLAQGETFEIGVDVITDASLYRDRHLELTKCFPAATAFAREAGEQDQAVPCSASGARH